MSDRKSILLIEDHHIIRGYYADRLRELLSDSVIIEAASGQTGLALFHSRTIDCVILDLSLPDMSGFEVLAKLLPAASPPAVPVVVLTAIDNGPLLQAAEHNGAFVALQKDHTSADELVTHVRRAMEVIPVDKRTPSAPLKPSVSA